MIILHYTNSESLDKLLSSQNDIDCENSIVLKDFQNWNKSKWELVNLFETNRDKDFDVFITIPEIKYFKAREINNIGYIAKILDIAIVSSEHYRNINSKSLMYNNQYQNKLKSFDLRKFFNDNFDIINELTSHHKSVYGINMYKKYLPITYENVISRTRERDITFIRQLLAYLFVKCKFNYINVAKMLKRDHSTIIHSKSSIEDYIYIYSKDTQKELINSLLTNLKAQINQN